MLAAEWCRKKVILETGCSSLAGMLQDREGYKSRLRFIIKEAQDTGCSLPAWLVEHTKRGQNGVGQNGVAHELAQLAKRIGLTAMWYLCSPACVEQLIARDCNFIFKM